MSNTTILNLSTTIGLTGDEWMEIVQNGASVRISLTQLAQFVKATTMPASVLITGQQAVTGVAVPLPAAGLSNGVYVKAAQTNAGPVFVGNAGVTTRTDGSGNGYRLDPGDSAFFCVTSVGLLYVVGTPADVVFYEGG